MTRRRILHVLSFLSLNPFPPIGLYVDNYGFLVAQNLNESDRLILTKMMRFHTSGGDQRVFFLSLIVSVTPDKRFNMLHGMGGLEHACLTVTLWI